MRFTLEQQAVIDHRDGTALVLAVAGAGKTASVTKRVQTMLEEGSSGRSFFVASYSNSAVQVLEQRLRDTDVTCATVHRLALWILRAAGLERRLARDEFKLLNRVTRDPKVTKDLLRAWQLERAHLRHPDDRYASIGGQGSLEHVDLQRQHLRTLESRGEVSLADLIPEAAVALLEHPAVQARIASRFKHWTIDEYQDVNAAQATLIDLAARNASSYVVVGDDDQAIYGFQGASTRHILEFPERHAGCRVYRMTENFRNPAAAVTLANAVIRGNAERFAKTALVTQGFTGSAELHLERDSGRTAFDVIRSRLQAYAPEEIAVLVRQHREGASLVRALIEHAVPVIAANHPRGNPNGRTLAALHTLATASRTPRSTWDDDALKTVEGALRDLGDLTRNAMVLHRVTGRVRNGVPTLTAMRLEGATALVNAVTAAITSRRDAAQSLEALGITDPDGLARLSEAALEALQDTRGVVVQTMHASKGLEYRIVVLLDTTSIALMSDAALEEERRLQYVALTRATHHLHIVRHPDATDTLMPTGELQGILGGARRIAATLERPPHTWDHTDADLIASSVNAFHLERFFAVYAKRNGEIARAVVQMSSINHRYWTGVLH
jgi:superfamily I DNA/RNA helicase